jgi:hypothetical protein
MYNIDRPSGHSSEIIEMSFNKHTHYDDVIGIIEESKWYVVKNLKRDDGSTRKIEIRPTYSNFIVENYPHIVYHISPSSNDESISQNGLVPKNNKKKSINFPERIYVVSELKTFDVFAKELNYSVGESNWSIWEINLSNIDIDYLYVDETVNQNLRKPTAFYLQDVNIPKECVKIIERKTF